MSDARRTLAVGLDAAEVDLVERLLTAGDMPVLAGLAARGRRARVRSTATVGSGTVWPTFYTGTPPATHGIHSGWAWDPRAMRLRSVSAHHLTPFWRDIEAEGRSVGIFDVPYAPPPQVARGFEVTEWGSHDHWLGEAVMSPGPVADEVAAFGIHPFSSSDLAPVGPDERVDLGALASACLTGARRKGELAAQLLERTHPDVGVVVFGEVHRSGHDLWQTVSGDAALHADVSAEERGASPDLVDVYREVDRQLGALIDAAEPDAIVVFSLHGFKPGRGVVQLLDPVLRSLGYAHEVSASRPTGRSVARGALAGVKRLTPTALKRIYHRRVPRETRYRLAAPTMMGALEWSRTRAFSLPSDQHGWLRVNLSGREAAGTVAAADYEPLLEELSATLRGLADEDGRPLVAGVIRPDEGGAPDVLPDLVVHWTDAAFAAPARVAGMDVEETPIGRRITGQHRAEGFCIAAGVDLPGEEIETADLHRLLR